MEGMMGASTLGHMQADQAWGSQAPQAPLMSAIMERLTNLRGVVGEASGDLQTLRTRLFGPEPLNAASAPKSATPPSAELEVLAALDELTTLAMSVNIAARTLNNRI